MDRVAVLDFGSQLTQLVARRVRECGVYSEVFPFDVAEPELRAFAPRCVILSGSSASTLDPDAPRAPDWIWHFGVPLLGLCYGMQTMAAQLGGATAHCARREYGHAQITLQLAAKHAPLFADVAPVSDVWMSHGDHVVALPPGFQLLAASDSCPIAVMGDLHHKFYGIQFHPETTQTRFGTTLFKNFLGRVAGCALDGWTIKHVAHDLVSSVRKQLNGDTGDVILGLSGGVDSSVVAAILHRAIGARLKCIIVDTGLMRLNEVQGVMNAFNAMGQRRREEANGRDEDIEPLFIETVDASSAFFHHLNGVTDPEKKRKIIGREFMRAFEQIAATKYDNVKWLAQGTIYPDVIESAHTGCAALIKTHHNVGGIPKDTKFKLIEPLRKLFKDEVRKVGETLGLPHDFLWRHPFPGPGLGVRILGEVTRERVRKLQEADAIFTEEIIKHGYYSKISQALAALLPVKAVAVKGDAREYDEVVALRAVHTEDFMTAQVVDLPCSLIKLISRRICNEVTGVTRVLYDFTEKPPATIEYE